MSLGGIAIAIGAMIDAAIVMIENMHQHLEREADIADDDVRTPTTYMTANYRLPSRPSGGESSWLRLSEVGPALFFSLLIITVSFLPVFTLEGQEGRLFKPLAFTKTFAMAAASLLSVTLVPVAMGLLIRGRIYRERVNPINRAFIRIYHRRIAFVLAPPLACDLARGSGADSHVDSVAPDGQRVHAAAGGGHPLLSCRPPCRGSASRAPARCCAMQDSILKTFPEVRRVWGKAGRANTATDPAGLDMFETTITLKPERQWRPGMTYDRLIAEMDSAVRTARSDERVDHADQGTHRHARHGHSNAGGRQDFRS